MHKLQIYFTCFNVLTDLFRITNNREWLRYVRTSKAKSRIRSWLKRRQRERSIIEGKAILEQGMRKYNNKGSVESSKKEYQRKLEHILSSFNLNEEKELLAALGYGRISVGSVMEALFGSPAILCKSDKKVKGDQFALQSIANQNTISPLHTQRPSKSGIVVGKERNILLTFCRSCRPLHGERVLGVTTKGKGIKVHRQGCKHLLEADDQRLIKVEWDEASSNLAFRAISIEVLCEDRPGVLASICNAVSSVNYSISSMNLRKVSHGRGLARLEVMLRTAEDLDKVVSKIKQEDGVISLQRR